MDTVGMRTWQRVTGTESYDGVWVVMRAPPTESLELVPVRENGRHALSPPARGMLEAEATTHPLVLP